MTGSTDLEAPGAAELTEFAHESEHQFARLLDFYDVPWEYEPTSFPIDWDESRQPIRYFTPDFYLPDEDLYIEITTMNQRLVTKKNRKIRRLRELHPEVKCKIFYQRDYLHLLVKYGLEDAEPGEAGPAPTRIPGPLQVTKLSGHASTG